MAKLNIKDYLDVPGGINIKIEGPTIIVVGKEGELKRRINHPMITISLEENKVIFNLEKGTKREKMMLKTFKAHINNMIKGVNEKYEYRLKICSSHFPMTVSEENNKIVIKNFLGEKISRFANIVDGSEVEINGEDIVVKSISKEVAGQTAANIERATRITNRDRRRFQDGIFMTGKAGVKI